MNQAAADVQRQSAEPEDHQDHDDDPEKVAHKKLGLGGCHSYAMLRTEDPGLRTEWEKARSELFMFRAG